VTSDESGMSKECGIMELTAIDTTSRPRGQQHSRRWVLAGAISAAATLLAGRQVAAKPGKRPGRSEAPGQTKVGVCHRDERGLFTYLAVSPPAVAGHEWHGDELVPEEETDGAAYCAAKNEAPEPPASNPGAPPCNDTLKRLSYSGARVLIPPSRRRRRASSTRRSSRRRSGSREVA
jgi:hypothetical protein